MANEQVSGLKRIQAEAQSLLSEEVAGKHYDQLSFGRRFVHFWVFAINGFIRNRSPARASALAYTTLLALVPILAVVLAVYTSVLSSKGDKAEQQIQELISKGLASFAPQLGLMPENAQDDANGANATETPAVKNHRAYNTDKTKELAKQIFEYIKKMQSRTVGATGVAGLIFVGISLLATIETAVNDMWGVQRGRSWINRIVQYWAALTLGPILLALLVGLKSLPYLSETNHLLRSAPLVATLASTLLEYLILVAAFGLFYQLMPNTKVQWKAAIVGAVVAAFLWRINGHLNFLYVSQVARNSKVYGGLATVPVFLIGLYFSWIIMLFGAQISYAFQNRRANYQDRESDHLDQRGRELIALKVMTCIAEHFGAGKAPPTLQFFDDQLHLSRKSTCCVLAALMKGHLIIETDGAETAYVPARPLEKISFHDILHAMRTDDSIALEVDPAHKQLMELWEKIEGEARSAGKSITLDKVAAEPKA